MIESGRVVAIEADALWVETQQQSTCGNCAVQKGCGQGLLQQLYPARRNHLRVLLGNDVSSDHSPDSYVVGDRVEFSLPDHIIVTGSALLYLVPIVGLLLGALLGGQFFANEFAIIVTAFAGFCLAAAGVRLFSMAHSDEATLQAQLVGHVHTSQTTSPVQLTANVI
ncbi:MAG: SoxR reducing system RseC family protein [Pseudomonadales bacterium]